MTYRRVPPAPGGHSRRSTPRAPGSGGRTFRAGARTVPARSGRRAGAGRGHVADHRDVGVHGLRGRGGVARADRLGDRAVPGRDERGARAGTATPGGSRARAPRSRPSGWRAGGSGRRGDGGVEALVALDARPPASTSAAIRPRASSMRARSSGVRRSAASAASLVSSASRVSMISGSRSACARIDSTTRPVPVARTTVPSPWRTATTPTTSSATRAWLNVARLTPSRAASSRSGGMRSRAKARCPRSSG